MIVFVGVELLIVVLVVLGELFGYVLLYGDFLFGFGHALDIIIKFIRDIIASAGYWPLFWAARVVL